ncbi:MAG TPA: type II toxin-antitoxin system CcdA family antitoxin [Allosphingosinicella sp.]|jgi:antitoxin CcdA|nr:type II toxin-antitoxin system CcdA family antitoxin [Allosphingosinicella sp.]
MAATAPKADEPALPRKLLDEALRLNVDVAGRSEDQVRRAVREAWIEENKEAIEGWNAWIEKNGLPLERYRAF